MFEVSILASGSKGNLAVIRSNRTVLLLDAGMSFTRARLQLVEHDCRQPNAVIISHDHSDHTGGAAVYCRKWKIPMYVSPVVYEQKRELFGNLPAGVVHIFEGESFTINDITVEPFYSPHDASESFNFVFTHTEGEGRLSFATDLGYATRLLINKLTDSSTIVLESNHDEQMLINGPYPWPLKQRIRGKQGHLSNLQALEVLHQVYHPGLNNVVLAHLSEENNRPDLAEENIRAWMRTNNLHFNLVVAAQNSATGWLRV